MPTRTVRHATVRYVDPASGGLVHVNRGESHDFPQEIIDRFEPLDAFLPEGQRELAPTAGSRPFEISGDATDEELKAWVVGATTLEVADFVNANEDEHPDIADRIGEALQSVIDTRGENRPQRPGTITEEGFLVTADGLSSVDPALETTGGSGTVPVDQTRTHGAQLQAEEQAGATSDELDPADVVQRNVNFVSSYLSSHPEQASAILEAEEERASEAGEEPRRGVVRAAEAAAGHTD